MKPPQNSSPFISSVARTEAYKVQARVLRVQWLLLCAQTVVIVLLVVLLVVD